MITAAKTASQLATHAAIAFALTYGMTGSVAYGGLAMLIEPVINVALLPLHERLWLALRRRASGAAAALAIQAAQKVSQTALHMGVAFAVMYAASGSLVTSWAMALLEPVCNVIVLPLHDGLWERLRERAARMQASAWILA